MTKPRSWDLPQGFFAYYWSKDAGRNLSVRDIQEKMQKELGLLLGKSSVDNMINAIGSMLVSDVSVKDAYEKWKSEQGTQKYFWRKNAKGEIESPYAEVRAFADRIKNKKGYYSEHCLSALSFAERFWNWNSKKRPSDWTQEQMEKWLGEQTKGSKFAAAVAVRAFSKSLKDVDGATEGLKGQPRIPAIMKTKEFANIFESFKRKVLELTPYEKRDEMEFILRVKPAVGIRTGERKVAKGLFGTKIGAPYKNEHGFNASHIQVVADTLIWHVLEKRDEEWDINFFFGGLDGYIKNYVKQKQNGQFLIEKLQQEEVNGIFGQACEALGIERLVMHDMRKVYVTALVKSGIPLEKAISLNVGWKDIGTAYKHYLVLADLGEKEPEYKKKLSEFFKMQQLNAEAIAA